MVDGDDEACGKGGEEKERDAYGVVDLCAVGADGGKADAGAVIEDESAKAE